MGAEFLRQVYQSEAQKLLHARGKSKIIHGTRNVDASGDEIEEPVRDFFRRRLPSKYYVGHGHIVDAALSVSRQIDVVIADNEATPILLETENGTKYFPYESVYLVGEVKSSYAKARRPIRAFSGVVAQLKNELHREATPRNYIGHGITLGPGLEAGPPDSLMRNSLFSFILFVNSGDADAATLEREYAETQDENTPTVVCFLDGKIVAKAEVYPPGAAEQRLGPLEMRPQQITFRKDVHWSFIEFLDPNARSGQALAVLMHAIFDHLNSCLLMAPPIQHYLRHVLAIAGHQAHVIERFDG